MNNRCRTRTPIYLAVLLMLATVFIPALYAASQVQFKLNQDGLIVVPVTVNGEGPFYFVLVPSLPPPTFGPKILKRWGLGRDQVWVGSPDGSERSGLRAVLDFVLFSQGSRVKGRTGCRHVGLLDG